MAHPLLRSILAGVSILYLLDAHAADPSRRETVRARSPDVMPFDMARTTHIFKKTPSGGVQRVVAKSADDAAQIELVRMHLKHLSKQLTQRDLSGPSHIHGSDMPGLAELRAAPPSDLRIAYREVPSGAELEYVSANPSLVHAVHQWFDAQVSDHGADAMKGHNHSMNPS